MKCPCGTGEDYKKCCEPYVELSRPAPTAETLMRSRYSAFALKKPTYLEDTTDPQTRQKFDFRANAAWALEATFTGLEILKASEEGNKGVVEFRARFTQGGEPHVHHEKSKFRKQAGVWFYREGQIYDSTPAAGA